MRIPMPTPGRYLSEYDVAVALALYPVLLDIARSHEEPITFAQLIALARAATPEATHPIHLQVPVGMGRRLEALRMFTEEYGYPDLSCLVVNAAKGSRFVDFAERLAMIRDFDWSNGTDDLDRRCIEWRKAMKRQVRRSDAEARKLRWEHYKANKALYHPAIGLFADEILNEIKAGAEVQDVYENFDNTLREAGEGIDGSGAGNRKPITV